MQHSYVDEDRKQLHHATGCFAYKFANLNLNVQGIACIIGTYVYYDGTPIAAISAYALNFYLLISITHILKIINSLISNTGNNLTVHFF